MHSFKTREGLGLGTVDPHGLLQRRDEVLRLEGRAANNGAVYRTEEG